jgi:hypothetical protein
VDNRVGDQLVTEEDDQVRHRAPLVEGSLDEPASMPDLVGPPDEHPPQRPSRRGDAGNGRPA